MKEKLMHNTGLKLLSVGLAFLFWVGVINSQDPVTTVKFDDIPVTTIHEDALTAKDKIPEIVEGNTVDVVIEARRSVCEALTAKDIFAVADFSKISVTDAVPIEVTVRGYSERDVDVIRGMNQVMTLRLEDYVSRDVRLKIVTTGNPTEGYVVGDTVSSPNMITVSGSSTQVGKIKEIIVVVNVDGISSAHQVTAVPVVYDGNGDVVGNTRISLSSETVNVRVPVLKTKTMNLRVTTQGTVADGYELSNVSYQPQSVVVAGTEEELKELGSTLIASVDVTGRSGTIEDNIDIRSLWDAALTSVRLVEEDDLLAVTIQITEHEEKVLELSENSILQNGIQKGLDVIKLTLSGRQVRVKGSKARLTYISMERLAPYIDFSSCDAAGIYELPIQFRTVSGITVQNELLATVEIAVTEEVQDAPEE